MIDNKLIFPTILLLPIISFASINPEQCGTFYDTLTGKTDKSIKVYKCDTKPINNTVLKNKYVENYKQIFEQIQVKYNKQFFNNFFVKKILNDTYINKYTLTYVIYQENNLFTTSISSKKLSNEKSYITSVKIGGEHIVLYHIPCNSKNMYNKLKKKLKKIQTIKELKQFLTNIASSNQIIIKELYNKGSLLIPTDKLVNSFNNIDNFNENIKQYAKPYSYTTNNKKELLKTDIEKILSMYEYINKIKYYKHHIKFFKPISKIKRRNLFSYTDKINSIIHKTKKDIKYIQDINSTKIPYEPVFYKANNVNNKIDITDKNISIIIKPLENKKIMINPSKNIKISLQTKIDIQNKGQLLRIDNKLIFNYDKKIYKKHDISILKDTYIDYKDMRFESIQNNYGILTLNLPFNKYSQYKHIKGSGILKDAICGYTIEKNTYQINCKTIRYNKITIKLRHEEE